MKILFSLPFFFSSFGSMAEGSKVNVELDKERVEIREQFVALNKKLEELKKIQSEIELSITKNLAFQQEIQAKTEGLLKATNAVQHELPSLKVHLLQPTNLYIFALPIVTIFIVVGGTFLSLRTIKIKSDESLKALDESNKNQARISDNNIASEHQKSKDSIISNSRQKWINTLRDEISSLVSHQTQYSASTDARKSEIFSKTWNELFKIELLLNPNETLHNELLKELNNGFSICTEASKQDEYRGKRAEIMLLAKRILKEEWKRVKAFE